ncbi:MAG: cyclic peptide export ABC transporter [SAR324 cluster bacterium]|nr:cyclic peptide export ABC transporter [SAR324 cluster bacterium]
MVNHIVAMIVFSGVVNSAILAIICAVAISPEKNSFRFFMLYLATLSIFLFSKRYSLIKSSILAETAVGQVRLRIIDKIRHADLRLLEQIGRSSIHSRLTTDTTEISMGFSGMIHSAQAMVMVVFAVMFLAFISLPIFLMTITVFGICGVIYFLNEEKAEILIRDSSRKETELFSLVDHVIDGFQELRINKTKNDSLFDQYLRPLADTTTNVKLKFFYLLNNGLIFSISFVHILIISTIFILPRFITITEITIIQAIAIILYIVGPFNHVLGSISIFSRTAIAIENLYKFEEDLEVPDHNYDAPGSSELANIVEFKQIELIDFEFHYADPNGTPAFGIGPCDLKIKANETLFIVGGNGSGKSTFLKLLTGLYYHENGNLKLDDISVNLSNYQDYRNLFSIVFTDFHLFDRLYGSEEAEESVVNELLHQMEIEHKTKFVDGRFSNINLSTGQKKRLALVAAILDEKPIYVFDEVAADQDPQFRQYFYETILPDLKKKGKTIIAATHDDKYFHTADRILKMEYGQFIPYEP